MGAVRHTILESNKPAYHSNLLSYLTHSHLRDETQAAGKGAARSSSSPQLEQKVEETMSRQDDKQAREESAAGQQGSRAAVDSVCSLSLSTSIYSVQ
jgi:hypothetical protein